MRPKFGKHGFNIDFLDDDKEFESLKDMFEKTKNPFFAWSALKVSFERQIQPPEWVNSYLKEAACSLGAIHDHQPKSEWQGQVLQSLGFSIKKSTGPGSPVREYQNLALGFTLVSLAVYDDYVGDSDGFSANDKIEVIAKHMNVSPSKARECMFEYAELTDWVDALKDSLKKKSI